MEKLNEEEIKFLSTLESIKGAIQDDDQALLKELNKTYNEINWNHVRQSFQAEKEEYYSLYKQKVG